MWHCFSFPICQYRGTVFVKIWWQVLLVAIYSFGIVMIHKKIIFPNLHVMIPWTLVPILGVATGMLLVFRTNTAYDRYWEARKLWSSMTTATRNLTRNIWVGIKEPEGDKTSKVLVEKVSALNILAAFGYATRNYLRGEYSYEDADLKQLLRHVPKFYNIDCKCKHNKQRRSTKDSLTDDYEGNGCVMLCRACYNTTKNYKFTAYEEETPTNIPMELSYLLGAYIKHANEMNLVDPSLLAPLNNALNSLVDCLTGFERILRTPIPLAYSVHLHHATWIYLLTLPSQLVDALGWGTAFASSLASFCLLGVLEIGWEIENPFGRDSNDLPLDDFCRVTHREIQKIMGRKVPSTDVWLMSPANRPLAPACNKNAQELARLPPDDLRALMKRNPLEIRNYFKNYAFVPDEQVYEKKPMPNFDATPTPAPSPEHEKKDDVQNENSDKASDSVSKTSKDEEDNQEDGGEEDEDDEVSNDVSSKRVSFALPDEEELAAKESSPEEEEEEDAGDAEENEDDEVENCQEKKAKTIAKNQEVDEEEDKDEQD